MRAIKRVASGEAAFHSYDLPVWETVRTKDMAEDSFSEFFTGDPLCLMNSLCLLLLDVQLHFYDISYFMKYVALSWLTRT